MRLILKWGNRYKRIFKIQFSKNGKSLIGNLSLFETIELLIPNSRDVDCHFTYFNNGNYHFSYKYFDSQDHLYVDHKIYFNHVEIFKGETRNAMELIVKRDKVENDPLDMFMMNEPLKAWDDRPIGHTFSAMGMTFSPESLNKLDWSREASVDLVNDLIIDVSDYLSHLVSFGCSVFSPGNPTHDFNVTPLSVPFIGKQFINYGLVICLYVVFPNGV